MNCCGAVGPSDFHHSAWFNKTIEDTFVPVSCCKTPYPSAYHGSVAGAALDAARKAIAAAAGETGTDIREVSCQLGAIMDPNELHDKLDNINIKREVKFTVSILWYWSVQIMTRTDQNAASIRQESNVIQVDYIIENK